MKCTEVETGAAAGPVHLALDISARAAAAVDRLESCVHYSLSARARCSWTAEALNSMVPGGVPCARARAARENRYNNLFLIDLFGTYYYQGIFIMFGLSLRASSSES